MTGLFVCSTFESNVWDWIQTCTTNYSNSYDNKSIGCFHHSTYSLHFKSVT